MNRIPSVLLILIFLLGCKSTSLKENYEFMANDDTVNLFAFVGEKISVEEFDPNENNTQIEIDSISGDTIRKVRYVMDNGFKSKYRVLKNVFNELKTDTIDFVSFDHYGRPGFEQYENVILYISLNEEDQYYQQKYQFDPVEKSSNGTWKGLDGKSIERLFNDRKREVLIDLGLFDDE